MRPLSCLISFFFFIQCLAPLSARVAVYSEATDVFELMDNVSAWHPSLDRVYRDEWQRKFPLSLEDRSQFSQYAEIRKKFARMEASNVPKVGDVFGKAQIGHDLFSEAFYSSQSIGEALKKLLSAGASPSDINFLKSFYSGHKKKITSFISESSQFAVKLLSLNKQWKFSGTDKVVKILTSFILGKSGRKFKLSLRPVWWPSSRAPQVDLRGPYLILRYHPLAHAGKWNMPEISEAAVKTLLFAQSANQRQNLTKVFEARCRGRAPELQEGLLILFSEMLPRSFKEKRNFDLYQRWAKRSFSDLFVKLLFPLLQTELKGKAGFAGRFMTEASDLCRALNRLAVVP